MRTCLTYHVRELKSFAFGLCRLIDVDENRIARCTRLDQRSYMNIRYKLAKLQNDIKGVFLRRLRRPRNLEAKLNENEL